MKRIALLAVIGAGLLALPSSASAQTSTCSGSVGTTVSGDPCVDVNGAGGEAVIDPPSCTYFNAWTANPITPGYAGIGTSCPETGVKDTQCDGADAGNGSNSGGCLWIYPAPDAVNNLLQNPVTAMIICGNRSAEDPKNSTRDGCSSRDFLGPD